MPRQITAGLLTGKKFYDLVVIVLIQESYDWFKNAPSFLSSVLICAIRTLICLFRFPNSIIVGPDTDILDVISFSVFL